MARYDFRTPRLFVDAPLLPGAAVPLEAAQAHYLVNVMRLKRADTVLVFNGIDGEWKAHIAGDGRRNTLLEAETQTRPQPAPGNLHYLFSPLKHARLDYMVQKAVEMGVSRLQPVIMRHTAAARVNIGRMRANAIEAAEQCGILAIPEVMPPLGFADTLSRLEAARHLVFCDEDAPCVDPVEALRALVVSRGAADANGCGSEAGDFGGLALVIGPEGGFDEDERQRLLGRRRTIRIALGPRILRADTAAVAGLAVIQAAVGDWH